MLCTKFEASTVAEISSGSNILGCSAKFNSKVVFGKLLTCSSCVKSLWHVCVCMMMGTVFREKKLIFVGPNAELGDLGLIGAWIKISRQKCHILNRRPYFFRYATFTGLYDDD